jgi:hypothetical protein
MMERTQISAANIINRVADLPALTNQQKEMAVGDRLN